MERAQLKAITAARGRSGGSKPATSGVHARLRAAVAARSKARSTQGKSIAAVFGSSAHRSITAVKPAAKPRS